MKYFLKMILGMFIFFFFFFNQDRDVYLNSSTCCFLLLSPTTTTIILLNIALFLFFRILCWTCWSLLRHKQHVQWISGIFVRFYFWGDSFSEANKVLSPCLRSFRMPCLVSCLFVQVSLGGYNHKLRILLETVLEQIAKFEVKPERFFVIKVLT